MPLRVSPRPTFKKVKGGSKKLWGCATNGIENPLCYVHGSVKSLRSVEKKKEEKKWKRQPRRPPDYLITLQRTEEISSLSGKDLLTDFGRFLRGKNFLSYESQSPNNFTSVIERALYFKDFNFFKSNIYPVNEYGKGKVWLSFKDHARCTFKALIIEEINYCRRYMKSSKRFLQRFESKCQRLCNSSKAWKLISNISK